MAFTHGKDAALKVSDSASTLTDVSSYLKSTGLPRQADVAETSTLGSTNKTYIPGLLDGTIPLEGQWDPTIDGILAGIVGGTAGAFSYYPAGTATGSVIYSGSAICTSYEITTGVDDVAQFSAEFQISIASGVTRGTV